MLKLLSRLHTPELLHALASMGHGDEIALVDANFPGATMARRLVRLDSAGLPEVLDACLQLMPLDAFVEQPALRMEVVGAPADIPEVQRECQVLIDRHEGAGRFTLAGIERHAFYARSREAFAVVATGEARPYGCIILKKGVVFPD
ncbi:MAG: ribose ABC transporter [Betaproteobacteria bacterium]|nr:ribose ABC transporter [Betaproteobacteria bacterium]MDE2152161.1 ribose ABC transporter [Betaproteobacteria bacterium]MDE2478555.1 ribose ABC transporter [Betaproteobacteria bacterium]